MTDDIAGVIAHLSGNLVECFVSPAEEDRNGEPANVTDALFAIADGLEHIAAAIRQGRGESNVKP